MDRNSAIGLTLIAVLLLIYFNFLAPQPPAETGAPVTQTLAPADTTVRITPDGSDTTAFVSQPAQEEKLTRIETNDLILTFSNRGGVLKEVELKKFKTYYQNPRLPVG